jgi:hypothetical protein
LRGLFGALVLEDMDHGRRGKRLRREYEEACMRALLRSRLPKRTAVRAKVIAER